MYLRSRFFKMVMLFIFAVAIIGGAFALYHNRREIKYAIRHFMDKESSRKYVMINGGNMATNELDVELRITNKSNKSNYISYRACFDPVKGGKLCNSWTAIDDNPFQQYMGKEIKSDEAWHQTVRLYDDLPEEELQGRHVIEVRYYYKKDVVSAFLGDANELLETRSSYIYYDSIAPTISAASLNGWIDKDSLNIKYNDAGPKGEKYVATGVKHISYQLCLYYEVVGHEVICKETPEVVSIKPNKLKRFKIGLELPSSYLSITVTDAAGNTTTFNDILKKDGNSPIVTINKVVNDETGQTESIKVTATDTRSLVSSVSYVFTNSNLRPKDVDFVNELEEFDEANIELPTKKKKYYLWIRAEDYAGNVTYSTSGPIYVCDSLDSCATVATNKTNYISLLYICFGVAIASLVSIVVIASKRREKRKGAN